MFFLDPEIPPEVREVIRERFGVDESLWLQYLRYMQNFLKGDLGYSFRHYPRPVWEIIMERLPRTLVLFSSALIAYFYLGFTLGKVIAWKRGGFTEYGATVGGVLLYTLFLPMYALLVIWFFALRLGWFPIGQFVSPRLWRVAEISSNTVFGYMILTAFGGLVAFTLSWLLGKRFILRPSMRRFLNLSCVSGIIFIVWLFWHLSGWGELALNILWHLALPVLTLATAGFAGSMLLTRDSMLETIREDYVMAARAKGLPDKVVRDKHAARCALLPVVTSFTLALAGVVNGGIITETIFSWPGMGLTLIVAIKTNDWPLALGTFAFTGILILIAHLVADIMYAVLDPRIRY